MIFNLLSLSLLAGSVVTMNSSRALEGYSAGFLPDCPGSTKEAIITEKSLKRLKIMVHGSERDRRKYNYYQTSELAKDRNLDFNKTTFLYMGGYMASPGFPISKRTAKTYKKLGYNVLILDSNHFTTREYPQAARIIRTVGMHAAQMLANLTKLGLDPKKLQLLGMSLGGHTAAFVAKNYRLLTGMNVSRLTALDPAGPCFRNLGPEDRLDKTDADFVEVIHTNINYFGIAASVGHVDYYVNGGEYQPGARFWPFCQGICSHVRAHAIWMVALTQPDVFIAIQCDSIQQARHRNCFDRRPVVTNLLGLNADKSKEGIFYLSTSNVHPFYLGEKGLLRKYDFYTRITTSLNKMKVLKI